MDRVRKRDRQLAKAAESLAGASSEYANGRYNNAVNRTYYACFQVAIAALASVGIESTARDRRWTHDSLQAQFAAQLVNRRKLYAGQGDVLSRMFVLRQAADYEDDDVQQVQSARALKRASAFVEIIRTTLEQEP